MNVLAGVTRFIFFALIVRPLVLIILGVNIRHKERLPSSGPAIVVANHNSHLDTMVLMTILPKKLFSALRPVAAADYFLKTRLLAWFSLEVLRIIPLKRSGRSREDDPLAATSAALERGDVLILFPEGSRGEPGELSKFKTGVARLAERHPDVPIYPLFMAGLERSLPKGEFVIVPFFCDVFVAERLYWNGEKRSFMNELENAILKLKTAFDESREH